MSSISDVLNIATSGLATAQAQVSATSDNIANVNTPGYARKIVSQSETVVGGQGLGVHVDTITRAYNAFLQKASLQANAAAGAGSVLSSFMDQAQQMFGDPSSSTNFFSGLDNVYSAFSTAANTPSSSIDRSSAVDSTTDFLNSASALQSNLSGLRDEANQQTVDDVTTINTLLTQISSLNSDIARVTVSGGDASGSQNQQTQLLSQLSGLMNVQVSPDSTGGVVLRSQDGVYLAGDQGAATLAFSTTGGGGMLTATPPRGQPMQVTPGGGEVGGLMQLSGVDIPQQLAQLGEFVSQAVSQINAASNASTSVPAPNTLTGSQIGSTLPTAIAGFSGKTTVAITNASGVMQQRVDITFGSGGGSMAVTDNSGATSTIAFTSANFLTQLNTALGSQGSASFTNGALSISATNSANGVAIADDPNTPSGNAGQGFSQFFGLNNLIQSTAYASVNSAVTSSTPSTFTPGGTLSLELTDANGAAARQVSVTVPTGTTTTVGDLVNSLNASAGAYGSFALDGQGHLNFTPNSAYTGTTVSVINDTTANSAGGPTLSQLLNVGWNTQAARANTFSVRSDIVADPTKLQLAQLDLSQTVNGASALAIGDGRGASAIAASGSNATTISAANGALATKSTVSNYASVFAGQVGAMASNADSASASATALQATATTQLSSADGVNLDTELVNLTTYQQSYNASARLVQAAKDMYDTLLQMV